MRRPLLLAAFEGWNDGGDAASAAVAHLAEQWDAQPVAAIDPEDYYDFQVARPRMSVDEGHRHVVWPTTQILLASPPGLDRDVLLVRGIEPSFRWRAFTEEILDLAESADVDLFVTLGAWLGPTPHTRPVPTTVSSDSEDIVHRFDIARSEYDGPTGIVGILNHGASQLGIPAFSLWAEVPHYAGGPPSPKATLALVSRLEHLLDLNLPRGSLEAESRAWQRGVEELASDDEEITEYVRSLETAQDTVELPEASGDAIAKEFERYLRTRGDDDAKG
nr:PAC2 family protein [Arsenicicoccus piscis]